MTQIAAITVFFVPALLLTRSLTERPDASHAGIYLVRSHLVYEFLFSLVEVAALQLCWSTSTYCPVTIDYAGSC